MTDHTDTDNPLDLSDTNNRNTLIENFDLDSILLNEGADTYNLLRVFASELDDLDRRIQKLYDERHISTATAERLDLLGDLARTERRAGEPDDQYRARIIGGIAGASSDTDITGLIELLAVLLDTSTDNIFVERANTPHLLLVEVPEGVATESTLTDTDIAALAQDAVPADSDIEVRTSGTFQFASDTYTPPDGTGFGEGTFGRIVQ